MNLIIHFDGRFLGMVLVPSQTHDLMVSHLVYIFLTDSSST